MLKGLVKNSIKVGTTAVRVRPMVPYLARGFASNNSNTGPDHSNFEGVKNSGNIADHSNFNGPKQKGIPVPDTNKDAEALRQDAANKHRIAAQTGDLTMEIQARVEQSMADRMRNHDKPNQGVPQPQQQRTQMQFDSAEQEAAYLLKLDAREKQSLGDRFDDDFLKYEARMEQSIADSVLRGNRQQNTQNTQTSTQTGQSQPTQQNTQNQQDYSDIEFHVGGKTLHTPYELKKDAAQKQSIATKTHDQALMDEARLEQRIADVMSPNQRGQPLYGQGPSGKIRATGQQQQQQQTPSGTPTAQAQAQVQGKEDEPVFDIYEELTLELSDEYPTDLSAALRMEDSKRL